MLPEAKTPPRQNLSVHTVLVSGPNKIGKSSWCSNAPDTLFLATEPGLNALDVYQVPIDSWDKLLNVCSRLAEESHNFKTIIIDTIDNAYKLCAEYICHKFNIEHESDLGYGKGWSLIHTEFQRVLTKMAFQPYGLYLISHSQEKAIETRTGKYTRIVPTLPDKARQTVIGLVDIILFCDFEISSDEEGKPIYRRVLRTKPNLNYEAGDRTGRLPEVIDLDFHKFQKAFNGSVLTPGASND